MKKGYLYIIVLVILSGCSEIEQHDPMKMGVKKVEQLLECKNGKNTDSSPFSIFREYWRCLGATYYLNGQVCNEVSFFGEHGSRYVLGKSILSRIFGIISNTIYGYAKFGDFEELLTFEVFEEDGKICLEIYAPHNGMPEDDYLYRSWLFYCARLQILKGNYDKALELSNQQMLMYNGISETSDYLNSIDGTEGGLAKDGYSYRRYEIDKLMEYSFLIDGVVYRNEYYVKDGKVVPLIRWLGADSAVFVFQKRKYDTDNFISI